MKQILMRRIRVSKIIIFIFLLYLVYILFQNHTQNQLIKQLMVEQIEYQNDMSKQLLVVESGISRDEKRRHHILNVEKIISKIDSTIPYDTRFTYAEWIVDETENKDIDPYILSALITQESRFNPKAISIVGAKGLGQIMSLTSQDICEHLRINYEDDIENKSKIEKKKG